MFPDAVGVREHADVGSGLVVSEKYHWRTRVQVHKYAGQVDYAAIARGAVLPYEVLDTTGNLCLRGGASVMWECLKGSGSTASTAAKKYFNTTAAIGVGNSTAAAAATQVALQGGSQVYKALTGGYPTHTTGSTAATVADIVYRSTYGAAEGNFAWQEWALANKASTTQRRLLNRKVQSLGTKTSAASWTFTVTLSLA
jgi:hypothetical protein